MSKALSRVRALVSEIDAIQTQGQKSASSVPLMKAVRVDPVAPAPEEAPQYSPVAEHSNVVSMASRSETTPAEATAAEGKVFIQLTGKIAVQLQLEHSEEIVEVRQLGESIEIRFTDGKAIHLPLKSVA